MKFYVSTLPLMAALLIGLAACTKNEEQAAPVDQAAALAAKVAEINALYEEFDEEFLGLNPIFATFRGDNRYNDQWGKYDFLSDEYAEAMYGLHKRYLERLVAIDPEGLNDQDRSNYEIFKLDRQDAIDREEQGFNDFGSLTPVSQFFSVPNFVVLLGSGANAQPFKTPADYDNWIKRSGGITNHMELTITRMREGVELGVVQPTILMQKTLPQLAAQVVDSAEQSSFWGPIERMPEDFSDEERERITNEYREHIEGVLIPAYAKLHGYITDEYLQHTRDTIGQGDVPGGAEYYAFLVNESTTTSLTPQEIHDIGKREVERLTAEMEKVKDQVGFDGDLQAFFEFLRTDPQFYYDKPEDLVNEYENLRERIDPQLDKLFDVMPKASYVLREVEEFRAQSMAAAQYFPGTPDGSRPGIFYVNTFQLDQRPKYMMEALSLHEANPGHHFQVTVAQELEELPAFRRFGGYTAYIEGWGLYAETLGRELGLYEDPYQYFGALFTDIWRANRLVVDTGMHALGWTRQEAIDWMMGNSPVTEVDVIAEVDRYIAIPSQALAYKIGQLKIRELRTRAEEALGENFDVREFHNQVLTSGALPLAVLEDKIDRWIASKET